MEDTDILDTQVFQGADIAYGAHLSSCYVGHPASDAVHPGWQPIAPIKGQTPRSEGTQIGWRSISPREGTKAIPWPSAQVLGMQK